MKNILQVLLPLALCLAAAPDATAQRSIRVSSPRLSFGSGQARISWGHQSNARIRSSIRTHHRHFHGASCYRTQRERYWVTGQQRLVAEPARYGWIQTACGTHWGLIEAAHSHWIQDPGYYAYRNRRISICGH